MIIFTKLVMEKLQRKLEKFFDMEKYHDHFNIPKTNGYKMFALNGVNNKDTRIIKMDIPEFIMYRKPNTLIFTLKNEPFETSKFYKPTINFLCQLFVIASVIRQYISNDWHLSQKICNGESMFIFKSYGYGIEVGIDSVYMIKDSYKEYEIKYVKNDVNITVFELWQYLRKNRHIYSQLRI